jgi:PhnB protein
MPANIELTPYLSYKGDCEAALNFYKDILDGSIEIVSRYDNPAMNAPEDFKNKILHACFRFSNASFFASDVMPKKIEQAMQPNISLSLGFTDENRATELFVRLSTDGHVHMPFKKQFWGDWHGNFTDQFGIRWMFNLNG